MIIFGTIYMFSNNNIWIFLTNQGAIFVSTRCFFKRQRTPGWLDPTIQGEQGCAALANLALDEANRSHIAQKEGVQAVPW